MYNMTVMVGKGSPKVRMSSRGSPVAKFGRILGTTSSSMKKVSPQSRFAKKTASSPKGMVFIVYSQFLNTNHNVYLLCM